MADLQSIIDESFSSSVQHGGRKNSDEMPVSRVFPFLASVNSSLSLPPWWSPARDVALRKFWKQVDYLAGAVYTMEARMSAIPFRVVPEDQSDGRQARIAAKLQDTLENSVQFGSGWVSFYSEFVEELLTQDNGVFVEVIGGGKKDGPLEGLPISLAILDSSRCVRTGHPIYPVIYTDIDGRRYKLHNTRVMYTSQMSSPISEMNGVGFCAISRAANIAQTLLDILVYKQEKLGSRPHRQILVTKGGLDPSDIQTAFSLAESAMDSAGYSRYSKVVVVGSGAIPEAGVESVELSKMPDGFDEETSIILGMATIALAFGVDARELFPSMSAGATRADAILQHLKQRGKGPGQILSLTESLINWKFLPPGYHIEFDFQDDAQDRQRAEIMKIRSDRRTQDKISGVITERIVREQMVEDKEISQIQFAKMELSDGRLPDGRSLECMFFSEDDEMAEMLNIGVENPLDVITNDKETVLVGIYDRLAYVMKILASPRIPEKTLLKAKVAEAALKYLEKKYNEEGEGNQKPSGISEISRNERRVRTLNPTEPTDNDLNPSPKDDELSVVPEDEDALLNQ